MLYSVEFYVTYSWNDFSSELRFDLIASSSESAASSINKLHAIFIYSAGGPISFHRCSLKLSGFPIFLPQFMPTISPYAFFDGVPESSSTPYICISVITSS